MQEGSNKNKLQNPDTLKVTCFKEPKLKALSDEASIQSTKADNDNEKYKPCNLKWLLDI